jgi:hypothetical protein
MVAAQVPRSTSSRFWAERPVVGAGVLPTKELLEGGREWALDLRAARFPRSGPIISPVVSHC